MMATVAARVALTALACAFGASQAAAGQPAAGNAPSHEPPEVAARLPAPAVRYDTPGFAPGRTGFTSHDEMTTFVQALRSRTALLEVKTIGESQQGRTIPMLAFGAHADERPTVMIVAMQRGDAPAAGEAALVLAQRLAGGPLVDLLRAIDVLIVPRANPDGAQRDERATADGTDLDADHLLLRTPEARALADVMARHRPDVVIDLGEFDPGGDWLARFGGWVGFDAMVQAASLPNVPQALERAALQWFEKPMRSALDAEGLTSQSLQAPLAGGGAGAGGVSGGSVHADTAQNVAALRTGIALRLDSRGAGLGRAHLARRVHAHVSAVDAALRSAARHADALRRLTEEQRRAVSASACTGELVVRAAPAASKRALVLLDPDSGVDRSVPVQWLSPRAASPLLTRSRPCGYLLPAAEQSHAEQLRLLGVSVRRLEAAATVAVESFRKSGTGFATVPARIEAPAGSFFVSMSQPLANVAAAALEPDSPGSLTASGLAPDPDGPRVMRVVEPATLKAADW
jgi:hypothetical protein